MTAFPKLLKSGLSSSANFTELGMLPAMMERESEGVFGFFLKKKIDRGVEDGIPYRRDFRPASTLCLMPSI
jgi:hypothetical protein